MRNEPNFSKSQMFITLITTTNYSKKWTLDTWSKRTQTNPIYGEQSRTTRGEQAQRVEPFMVSLPALSKVEVSNLFSRHSVWRKSVKIRVNPWFNFL